MKTAVLTVEQIADQLGQPPARVAYLIAKLRLKPVGCVGIIRLFSEQQKYWGRSPFNTVGGSTDV